LERTGWSAERLIGQRDGVTVGLALELFRRRHGRYPGTLGELVPDLLPALPLDRIDGQPLRYRLIDGRPLIYSVGVDRQDDGGRLAVDAKGKPAPWIAAAWPNSSASQVAAVKGDWVLYPLPADE
jgi:hypothetical protein